MSELIVTRINSIIVIRQGESSFTLAVSDLPELRIALDRIEEDQAISHVESTVIHGSPDDVILTWCGLGAVIHEDGRTIPFIDFYADQHRGSANCQECKRRRDAWGGDDE